MPEFAKRSIFYGFFFFFEIVDDTDEGQFTTFPHFGALKWSWGMTDPEMKSYDPKGSFLR